MLEKILKDMEISQKAKEKFKSLSDEQIADLLFDIVWANMPIYSATSELLEETISRVDPKFWERRKLER